MPRYGPSSPFTGHLSVKSNAFCTDSSSLRLSTLYLIKNHMAVHYNKILSAKAVVDCSMPVSMTSSIKYSDQQRREKLKKELAQCEKDLKLARITSQTSKMSTLSSSSVKLSEESQDKDEETEEEIGFSAFSKLLRQASDRQFSDFSSLDKTFRNETQRTFSAPSGSSPRRQFSAPVYNTSRGGGKNIKNPRRFQLFTSKAPSGDLLEKHSALFTNKHLPFTPRTLKTEAKSFLSQYRYYTPAKRKKNSQDQLIEAETQTDLSSFKSHFVSSELNNILSEDVILNEPKTSSFKTYEMKEKIIPSQNYKNNFAWEKVKDDALQYPVSRASIPYYLRTAPVKKIQSEEEELLYLSFIEDVTDEILKLGLFSNRILERLFERHIEQNKHHLEEKKMRHMLHVLKLDLGFSPEEKSEKLNGTLNMLNLLDFEKLETPAEIQLTSENKIPVSSSKSEEHQKSLDLQDKILESDLTHKEMTSTSPSDISHLILKDKDNSEDKVSGQVISETNPEPSAQTEEPSVSYTTSDPVSLTESFEKSDNDVEKTDSLSVSGKIHLEECVQDSITEDNDHATEESTSKLPEIIINEQYPLDN
ncbi:spermatogenesis-associated protein 7 isoform X2 [Macrotis lagotis]